jgi:hypothetical protein
LTRRTKRKLKQAYTVVPRKKYTETEGVESNYLAMVKHNHNSPHDAKFNLRRN